MRFMTIYEITWNDVFSCTERFFDKKDMQEFIRSHIDKGVEVNFREIYYEAMGIDISQEVIYGYRISEEDFDNLGDDLQDELLDSDNLVMVSPMTSSECVFGIRVTDEFVEMDIGKFVELREELDQIEVPKNLNLHGVPVKLYVFTQYS